MTTDLFTDIPRSPTKERYVEIIRDMARQVIEECGEVTSDDLHERCPIPTDTNGRRLFDGRIMAAAFDGLTWCGFTKSRRKECHHRVISRFTKGGNNGQQP